MNNIEKYKEDLNLLIEKGKILLIAIKYECYPKQIEKEIHSILQNEDKVKNYFDKIIAFKSDYQSWYSESLVLIKQLLPDRLSDFIKLYEKPKTRKDIKYGNYVIEDYLQGLNVTNSYSGEIIVGKEAAIPQFEQQLNILKSVSKRFESTLFDIKQLVQADLFDNELAAAKELNLNKFPRGAGAIAGVILEKHLAQVLQNHNLKVTKKHASISDYNEILKNSSIYDIPTWRKIQYLGDIRNLCDHNKKREPTLDEVNELISGVEAVTKNIY